MGSLLKEKICLVTGTTKGIGKQIAERFAIEGATIYASSRTDGSLDSWAETINSRESGMITPVYFDMTDSAGIKDVIQRIKKDHGRLDVLVNNAGMISNELLGMISIDKMRKMFDVNVFGLMELSQLAAVKLMRPNKSGSIINIASVVGVEGNRGQVAYSASKGAVISITKSMAKELAPDNIRVNAVAPGMVLTDRLDVSVKNEYSEVASRIGMGRWGTPKEISDACLFFASDMSKYATGQILTVDGGNGTLSREFYDIEFK